LGNEAGLQALEAALIRSTGTLLKRKNKKPLIIDLDSIEDPAHGKQGLPTMVILPRTVSIPFSALPVVATV
jgi:hypothetical protein